jgi:hypothetical protein
MFIKDVVRLCLSRISDQKFSVFGRNVSFGMSFGFSFGLIQDFGFGRNSGSKFNQKPKYKDTVFIQ